MVFFQTEMNYIYIVPGTDKNDTHFKNKKDKHSSKHSNRVYKTNKNIRRKGSLKQPGGSSCNQRR